MFNKRIKAIAFPLFLAFFGIYLFPFFISIYFSTLDSTFNRKFVGMENYRRIISNEYFALAMGNTLRFTLASVPLVMIVALLIVRLFTGEYGQTRAPSGIFLLPMLMPTTCIITLVSALFSPRWGAFAAMLQRLGLDAAFLPLGSLYYMFVWKNTGILVILIQASMNSIPGEVINAAMMDGASDNRIFFSIAIPIIAPTLYFAGVLSVVYSFRIFKESYLLYGSYPDKSVYFVQHYMNNHFEKLNYQYLTSGAILFASIVLMVVIGSYQLIVRSKKGVVL